MYLAGGPGIEFSILLWVGVEKGQGGGSNIDGGIMGGGSDGPWILGCAAGAAWIRALVEVGYLGCYTFNQCFRHF